MKANRKSITTLQFIHWETFNLDEYSLEEWQDLIQILDDAQVYDDFAMFRIMKSEGKVSISCYYAELPNHLQKMIEDIYKTYSPYFKSGDVAIYTGD
jgi:hypothetical protein